MVAEIPDSADNFLKPICLVFYSVNISAHHPYLPAVFPASVGAGDPRRGQPERSRNRGLVR